MKHTKFLILTSVVVLVLNLKNMDDQEHSPLENDELSEYDIYSKTPPRTKILRKNRDRKNRERQTRYIII